MFFCLTISKKKSYNLFYIQVKTIFFFYINCCCLRISYFRCMFQQLFIAIVFGLLLVRCSNEKPKEQNHSIKQNLYSDINEGQMSKLTIPQTPKSMTFCGETIYFDDFDKQERLDLELIINTHYHSSTIQLLKRAKRYFPEIEKTIKKEGLPEDIKYIAVIESGLKQATSPSGAKGFWQFMTPTAKEYGLEISNQVDERKNISKSTEAAMKYLTLSYQKFNDWKLAISSYNCGIGGLKKQIEKQQTNHFFDLFLNPETSRYYFRALALKLIMENPEKFGFHLSETDLYQPIPTKSIKITSSIDNLMIWAKENGTSYQKLKILNPWLISDKLKVNKKIYFIKIPA